MSGCRMHFIAPMDIIDITTIALVTRFRLESDE